MLSVKRSLGQLTMVWMSSVRRRAVSPSVRVRYYPTNALRCAGRASDSASSCSVAVCLFGSRFRG